MPIWRNRPSMPKVRASSGTIGTMRWPSSLSLTRMFEMIRTKAMVVEISRPSPVPLSSGSNASSAGTGSDSAFWRRCGR